MERKAKSKILGALRYTTVDEKRAVEFLEQQRWNDEPACPHCGDMDVYKMMESKSSERNKDFRWRCRGCKKMYSVRTKTVFEESRLPLRVWVYAIWKACSSKKGISALQLSREMEITHKSALFVLRRIRHGLAEGVPQKLQGDVEVDEVYIGGRPRYKGNNKRGRGTTKTPVLGMVERGGRVRFRVMERLTAEHLGKVIAQNADLTCRLLTDELQQYQPIGKHFEGGHEYVKHSAREYVRGDVHTNNIESVFSLLRRGIHGTFHSISKKHLPNYLNEFEFRFNTRKMDDGARVVEAVRACDGKRLEYRESVDHPPYVSTNA